MTHLEEGKASTIPYSHKGISVLTERRSLCLSSKCEGSFSMHFRSYLKQVGLTSGKEVVLYCEDYWDASPAGCDCDSVQVLKASALGTWINAEQGGSMWWHNESLMRLRDEGSKIKIIYEKPREGLRPAGVQTGMLLFRGERKGSEISGKARFFSAICGPVEYHVNGTYELDERRITVFGMRPILDRNCRSVGSRRDILVFDRAIKPH